MRAVLVLRAVSDGVIRRQVQAVVIGLVVLVFTAAAALAPGPLADVSAPLERAFAAQHGAEVTATAKASPAQLAATTGLAEVTAAAGPFPETTVTATMLVSPRPGQSGSSLPTQQMTVVGRAWPGGPVDDLTLHSGRWATQPGQAVVLTDGQASDDQASPVGIGTQIAVTGVPGSPRLTVVGTATSITHTAQVWVAPAEIAALRAPGTPDLAQMLYRFASAGTTTQAVAVWVIDVAVPTTVRRGEPGTLVTVICVPMPTRGAWPSGAWPSVSSTACPGCVAQWPAISVRSSTGPPGDARPTTVICWAGRETPNWPCAGGTSIVAVTVVSGNGPAAAVTPASRVVAAS